jgi:hypothetical protein
MGSESDLGAQLAALDAATRQQGLQASTNVSNTLMPLYGSFVQSMPQASTQLSLLPGQMQTQKANILTGLTPLVDFDRQLREADYLRRQGFAETMYTGLPYTPGSTTSKASGTGNIFDQLGGTISSGVTGGSGGFSTLGTKT